MDLAATEAADPDVILGTKEAYGDMYDDLKRIAPTVMSEGDNWKLNLRLHGEALGRTNDAEKLLIDWDNRAAKVRAAFADSRIGVVLVEPNAFGESILGDVGVESGGERRTRSCASSRRPNGPVAACWRPARRSQSWKRASVGSSSPDPLEAPLFCRSRQGRMSTQILDALSRLAARRFGSFADAATDVLDLLESASAGRQSRARPGGLGRG